MVHQRCFAFAVDREAAALHAHSRMDVRWLDGDGKRNAPTIEFPGALDIDRADVHLRVFLGILVPREWETESSGLRLPGYRELVELYCVEKPYDGLGLEQREIEANQRALGPIEQPRRQADMLGEEEPLVRGSAIRA